MFFDVFGMDRDTALKAVQTAKDVLTGVCFSADGQEMRFRLYGNAAYVLPKGKHLGRWIHRRGLLLMGGKMR